MIVIAYIYKKASKCEQCQSRKAWILSKIGELGISPTKGVPAYGTFRVNCKAKTPQGNCDEKEYRELIVTQIALNNGVR